MLTMGARHTFERAQSSNTVDDNKSNWIECDYNYKAGSRMALKRFNTPFVAYTLRNPYKTSFNWVIGEYAGPICYGYNVIPSDCPFISIYGDKKGK
jgi:hypothetical protein